MADIYWAGDSTVQYNSIVTYPQTGIGQAMNLYIKSDVNVFNKAKNGRSTKSFLEEGRFAEIESSIKAGDFLFIQFGHNDEKINDPTRYTTPFGTFIENLKLMANAAIAKGAYPVLITPIERRCFEENGKLGPGGHGEYVAGMKQAASELNIPCIDLYTKSRNLLNELGPVKAELLHVVCEPGKYPNFPDGMDDHTHLCYKGAVIYAYYIAEGLKALGGVYSDILVDYERKDII